MREEGEEMQSIKRRMIPLALSAIMALSSQVYAKATPIDIVAQPLASALTQFAEQAHVQVLVAQELVSGKVAPEVRGEIEPIDALKALLKNSGLEAISQNGTLVIKKVEKAQEESLEKITMTGDMKPEEGSAEAGYKVKTLKNVGPWGEKELLDTPYSMHVVSSDLIENMGTNSTDQIFKMDPTIQLLQPYDMNGLTRVMMRGFLMQTSMIDGLLGHRDGQGIYVENIDRIETLTGLSGFMYGVGNVGGTLNYVTKRPTETPLYSMTIGNYGGSQYYAHADVSDKIDKEGKVAYRLNLMKQEGDTVIDNQHSDRWMVSGAIDWRPTDDLLISTDGMYGHYRVDGRPGQWLMNSTSLTVPSAPDAKGLWASSDTFTQNNTTHVGTKVAYNVNDNVTFRAGYGYEKDEGQFIISQNRVTSDTTYKQSMGYAGASNSDTHGVYSYIDTKFDTLGVEHKTTFGVNGYKFTEYTGYVNGSSFGFLGSTRTNLSLFDTDSANISLPDFDFDSLAMTKSAVTINKNILLGDEITFNDQWSALVGANYSRYMTRSYTDTGNIDSEVPYRSKITPTVSLLYKPLPYITTYATYMESLQPGTVVTSSSMTYTNNGEVFAPVKSKQYEIGVKTEVGQALITTALFQIDKANPYSQDNDDGTYTFFENGQQRHKGAEITVSGKVTDNLSLLGGVTVMDAEVIKSTNDAGLGKIPQGVAEQMAKIYAEYGIPNIHGLTLTGGVYYVGKSYFDVNNNQEIPSYVTADVGLRYITKMYGNETIFRANVTNVTDKDYWISNYTIGAMVGAPRDVTFSMTMKF